MIGDSPDPRTVRRWRGSADSAHPTTADLAASPYRVDRDRIVASPFFARLGGVTQVVSASGSSLLHNRLTHSLKVAQVARAIAERLSADDRLTPLLDALGGCDPDVVEAAGLAHDLGHPPFGHLGEQVLDRLARHRFGLPDGFEGNAQSLRIVTTADTGGPSGIGLDLTAAVRAAILKYPWTRLTHPDPHPRHLAEPPRGASEPSDAPGTGSSKFSVYITEWDEMAQARAPFDGKLASWQQTVEASVMDIADDIAYAIHDLEDFHRIGVLQYAPIAAELDQWRSSRGELAELDRAELAKRSRRPGCSLELLRRRLHHRDSWIVDDDAFAAAVARVSAELVDGLLATPFDGSAEAEQTVGRFSAGWTTRLVSGITVVPDPPTRSGHVMLGPAQWHEVQVLKFVHKQFVLLRPDLALHQRGQAQLITALVEALDHWLEDRYEAKRLPHRLQDLAERAEEEYSALAATDLSVIGLADEIPRGMERIRKLARGRAVIDFVASLTDGQAAALLDALSGRSSQPWSDMYVL
ncbi:deoxyguanosinetriphosphate triphosphohydrolase family protein [Nocardia concava]|uniref:deoxyguanosinetriphosphate triphosphohydrolase family protein n=1 Tax=Nocardia concava TaxID=257281 RepID=UPI0005929FC1|nr:dNTP triphosphohydrolase [Nocardia concava]